MTFPVSTPNALFSFLAETAFEEWEKDPGALKLYKWLRAERVAAEQDETIVTLRRTMNLPVTKGECAAYELTASTLRACRRTREALSSK